MSFQMKKVKEQVMLLLPVNFIQTLAFNSLPLSTYKLAASRKFQLLSTPDEGDETK